MSKYGYQKGNQRYKCASCLKVFIVRDSIHPQDIWQEYTEGKQTYAQLAKKYNCSIKSIQRKIDTVKIELKTTFPSVVNLLFDTTYFGRKFGVMVFKDSITSTILYTQFVKSETIEQYLKGVEVIIQRGISIQSVICDGKKGIMQAFPTIPVQMCQFHQVAIMRRYLTKRPKMQPSIELWKISQLLTKDM